MHLAEATLSGDDIDDQQVGAAARADDVRVAVARGPARADVQAAMSASCVGIAGTLVGE